jgi:hypothetical protein
MNANLSNTKGRVVDGWRMLLAFALYWVALLLVALTLASGTLVV